MHTYVWLSVYFIFNYFIIITTIFWPGCAACGVLVLQAGVEARPQSESAEYNYWNAREFPLYVPESGEDA